MPNIFVANTFFHLIMAQSIIESGVVGRPYLLVLDRLLVPESPIFIEDLWERIEQFPAYSLGDFSFIPKIQKIIDRLVENDVGDAELFLANDFQVESQIIRSCLPGAKVNLFDDGMAYYTMGARRSTWARVLLRRLASIILLRNRIKNVIGMGYSEYSEVYCLLPELNQLEGKKHKIDVRLYADLSSRLAPMLPDSFALGHESAIWLSQPFVEDRVMSFSDETKCFELCLRHFEEAGIRRICIKAHPRESQDLHNARLGWFMQNSRSMEVLSFPGPNVPVEALFAVFPNVAAYGSITSTALIMAKLFGVKSDICFFLPSDLAEASIFGPVYSFIEKIELPVISE